MKEEYCYKRVSEIAFKNHWQGYQQNPDLIFKRQHDKEKLRPNNHSSDLSAAWKVRGGGGCMPTSICALVWVVNLGAGRFMRVAGMTLSSKCPQRRLLALSFELNTAFCPSSEYDEYGFMTVPDYEIEDWKLLAKIQALEIKSNKLWSQEIVEKPLRDRWNSIGELNPSGELKNLIRSGIPVEHRQRVWRWMVSRHCSLVPGHYQRLLEQSRSTEHPACRQIELDLPRTLTNNKHFSSPSSHLIPKLRRVLLAFSWHNPAIGYCQGLNR